MPKYHLVSDVLFDFGFNDSDGMGFAYLRQIIYDEWNDGNIKLLHVSPGSAELETVEPAPQRQLTLHCTSGERWFTCSISQGIKELFKDPVISDEDLQLVKRQAAAAGLVVAGHPLHAEEPAVVPNAQTKAPYRKATKVEAVRQHIQGTYPQGIPPGVTDKILAAELLAKGIDVYGRTIRRARGGK